MPEGKLTKRILLPEFRLVRTTMPRDGRTYLWVEKTSTMEVCPKCATPATGVYDRRMTTVRDAPIRDSQVVLKIKKRRFFCRSCQKPFTEPVPGVRKGKRFTERYRKSLLWAAQNFACLKSVLKAYHCSTGFLYQTLYAELARKQTARSAPWPKAIGIDEHYFRRERGFRQFVTMVTNVNKGRLFEVALGKRRGELEAQLAHIPGREHVRSVCMDLCDPYRGFARNMFPNATIVADKFHVLRLLNPAINRYRKAITGDVRSHPLRRLLLRNGYKLPRKQRLRLEKWLKGHPDLAAVYFAKETLFKLYRCRGRTWASRVFTKLTDALAKTDIPELRTLRKTLMKWRNEILAYFDIRLTNALCEGMNNVAKVVKKQAFGYKNFENYRLRLLTACAKT